MGTRADFYIGIGEKAEWLGSIALDGYEFDDDKNCALMQSKSENEFRNEVKNISLNRDDFTNPEMGWPWPWDNSNTTDYTYSFNNGKCEVNTECKWPGMKKIKNVNFGNRSGLMIITKKEG